MVMCGRYALADPEYIHARYATKNTISGLVASFNVAPTMEMPTVSRNSPNQIVMRKWGLVPYWKKREKFRGFFNARAESVFDKLSFSKAIRGQRCLVPVSGFYEWRKRGQKKIPYFFSIQDERLFSLAGIWDRWENGDNKESYAIVTTEVNETMKPIHERMPVVLSKRDEDKWLDSSLGEDEVRKMMNSREIDGFCVRQVSNRVNNVVNNDESLISECGN